MIRDEAYLRRLRDIFAANDPSDGIDRYHGFGRDVWVEALEPTDDGPYEELEVTYGIAVPERPGFRDLPRRGTTRLPYGREWRELSGYTDPAELARKIADMAFSAAGRSVQRGREQARRAAVDAVAVRAELPGRDELWALLVGTLDKYGVAREVDPGRIELIEERDGGEPGRVTVVVSPDQWHDFVVSVEIGCRLDRGLDAARAGDGPDSACFALDELVQSRHQDNRFIVFDRGGFHSSIREERPLVKASGRVTPRR
jgi:hypothetical protein